MKEEDKENTRNNEDIESDFTKEENSEDLVTGLSVIRFISTALAPILLLLAPSTGCYSIGFFAMSIAEKMHMGNPAPVAIAVGMMRVLGVACGGAFVQKFGRRFSLIFSSTFTSLSLGMISLLLMLDILPPDVYNSMMVTLLVLVMFCTSLGMAPVPWVLLGEWPQVKDKYGPTSI